MSALLPGGRSATRIFRAFHGLVADTVERLESEPWPADRTPELGRLRDPLIAAITGIGRQLGEDPPADPAVARQILYLLAVHADDRALAARWPGRAAWAAARLEEELFGTALGAPEVVARAERLLNVPTPENRQLARLFLYALGLGLGSGEAGGRHDALRRRLLEFARPTRQPAPHGRRRIFRQAYRHTVARGERRLLPDLRGWLVLAAAVLVTFLLLSAVVWEQAVEGIAETLAPATAAAEPAGPPESPKPAAPPTAGEEGG